MIRSPFEMLILGMSYERGHRLDMAISVVSQKDRSILRRTSGDERRVLDHCEQSPAQTAGVVHYVSGLPGQIRRLQCSNSFMIYRCKCPVRF